MSCELIFCNAPSVFGLGCFRGCYHGDEEASGAGSIDQTCQLVNLKDNGPSVSQSACLSVWVASDCSGAD